jgi:hypothetical protein
LAPGNNNSDRNSTLPLPELNPLLNPVLGAHMGRWAEVYFTSPPEKREEAVLELLRELQGGTAAAHRTTSAPESAVQPAADVARHPAQKPAPIPAPRPEVKAEGEPAWIVCESCGGRNIQGNRFCGMCAAPLAQSDTAPSQPPKEKKWATPLEPARVSEATFVDRNYDGLDRHEAELQQSDLSESDPDETELQERDPYRSDRQQPEFDLEHGLSAVGEYSAAPDEPRALPASAWPERPDVPSLFPDSEDAPTRRRIYVGAVVGIVILGLLYVAWKSSAARSGTSQTLAQPVPSAETQPATPDQSPPPAAEGEVSQAPASKAAPAVEQRTAAETNRARRNSDANIAQPDRAAPAAANAAANEDQASGPIVASLQGNGSEELTVAESYLNGTHGRTRDTSEAAKWLWRSFGKKNGAAALLLSDLYVRGDGVPKSCDQARLLLDAAARKGTAGAAERLRNLPSLGCQ